MLTQFLIKRFVSNKKPVEKERERYGKLSSLVGIAVNFLLALIKILIGFFSASIAVLGDGVNNLFDCGSALISLISFSIVSRPADDEHPYGHARFEYISSALVSLLILWVGFSLMRESIRKIANPEAIAMEPWAIVLLVFSIFIKIWLYFFYKKIAGTINSKLIFANAADSLSDVLASSAILFSLLAGLLFNIHLDGPMGILVSLLIMKTGIEMLRQVMDHIIGTAPDEELLTMLEEEFMAYEGILGMHDLLVHDYGPGKKFVTVHLEVPAEQSLLQAHRLIDKIEKDIQERHGIILTIHLDPLIKNEDKRSYLEKKLVDLVRQVEEDFSVRDLRLVDSYDKHSIIFSLCVPEEEERSDLDIEKQLQVYLGEKIARYNVVIRVERI